jgi:hypothetical protein
MFTRGRWPLASGFQTTRVWSLPGSPGKKTDQIDCERLAGLHQYALVRRSFIPLAPIRELRDLTRRRTHLQQRDQPHSPVAGDGQHRVGLGNEQCRRGHGPVHPGGFSNNQAEPTGDLRRFCERLPKQKKEEIRKRCGRPPITEHFQFMLSELPDELERLDKKVDAMEVRSGRR